MSTPEPEQERLRPYPLYNTTLTLYHLSPLYRSGASSLLVNAILVQHARHLKDLLTGEVLRGVRVGFATGGDEGLARAGKLKECRWRVLGDETSWIEQELRRRERGDETMRGATPDEEDLDLEDVVGIHIEVEYEKITYMAALLRNTSSGTTEDDNGFTRLPLLATRMPAPLRETFLDYLSTTFDTHVSQLKLPSEFLTSSLEKFVADVTTPSQGDTDEEEVRARELLHSLRNTVKDLAVTLSFTAPISPLLRSIEISISKADIPGFIAQGKKIQPSEPPKRGLKRKHDRTLTTTEVSNPFTRAFSQYINTHLALSLTHPDIRISKIACGAFALGAEGKVKIFPPIDSEKAGEATARSQTATTGFLHGLIERATLREPLPDGADATNAKGR
jgi:Kinetochore complex Sim4 subunit Fta1